MPALLDVVQTVVDEQPGRFRFLLSGSSARKLRRGQVNLLPGRVHLHYLHPLLQRELGRDFDLQRVLAHGSLPGIYAEPDQTVRAQDLRAYVDVYLREEIQAEALVRNLGGYARLLDLTAAASKTSGGSCWSISLPRSYTAVPERSGPSSPCPTTGRGTGRRWTS